MESHGVTIKFLEGFLPPWDKIKSFEVTTRPKLLKPSGINCIPKIAELFVKVSFENPKKKPISLAIKTPSPDSLSNLRRFKWFEKEVFFHDTILIEFKALLTNCDDSKDKTILKLSTESFIAASICNVTADPLENFIAISDLRARGFRKSKLSNLDFKHCQLVVKELAKLHALSWAYKKSKAVLHLEKLHPVIQETFLNDNNKDTVQYFFSDLDTVGLVQQNYGDDSVESQVIQCVMKNGTDLADILIKFLNYKGLNEREIEEKVLSVLPSTDDDFVEDSWAVGSHGDLRNSNLLFKYDPKNPEQPIEISLVNFHCFRETCPTIDLVYLMYTSTDSNTREDHLQDLLESYHEHFVYFCNLLKKDPYPGFNINSLRRRYHRARIFGILSNILCSTDTHSLQQQKSVETEDAHSLDSDLAISDFVTLAKTEDKNFESLQTQLNDDFNSSAKEFGQQRSF